MTYDVVGPICETGDTFTRDRALPPLEAGDLVAFMTAGAYGAAMSSEYNTRPLVPEVLVKGDRVRRRPPAPDLRGHAGPRAGRALAVSARTVRVRNANRKRHGPACPRPAGTQEFQAAWRAGSRPESSHVSAGPRP